jgi:hypothetical protein
MRPVLQRGVTRETARPAMLLKFFSRLQTPFGAH